MKFFIKFSTYALAISGLILAILPSSLFPSFLDVQYMGLAMIGEAALIYFLPRILAVPTAETGANLKNQSVVLFQFLMTLAFVINGLGDAGLYQLYKIGFEFDKFLHLSLPVAATFVFCLLFYYRFEFRRWSSLLTGILIVSILAIGWEVFEYGMDYYFHTRIHGVNGINMSNDTQTDLLLDALGMVAGSIIAWFNTKPVRSLSSKPMLSLKKLNIA